MLGIVPIIRKLSALVGLAAGVVAIVAAGMVGLNVFGGGDEKTALAWGLYATAGVAVLLVLTSLFGLRSED